MSSKSETFFSLFIRHYLESVSKRLNEDLCLWFSNLQLCSSIIPMHSKNFTNACVKYIQQHCVHSEMVLVLFSKSDFFKLTTFLSKFITLSLSLSFSTNRVRSVCTELNYFQKLILVLVIN